MRKELPEGSRNAGKPRKRGCRIITACHPRLKPGASGFFGVIKRYSAILFILRCFSSLSIIHYPLSIAVLCVLCSNLECVHAATAGDAVQLQTELKVSGPD